MIGEYGDIVTNGDRIYLSWYPAGLLKSEKSLAPDPEPVCISLNAANRVRQECIAAIGRYMPGCGKALAQHAESFEIRGGYISAWGQTIA